MATDPTTESWRAWIAEKAPVFLLYARQCSRCEEDARDVLQEALADAWRRSGGEVPQVALVFATIRRRAIDFGRSLQSRRRREADHASITDLWFEPDVSALDTHQTVAAALAELPDPLRETVTLKLWAGLTYPEIAAITGVPVPTAASRYRSALDRLRETLTPLFA